MEKLSIPTISKESIIKVLGISVIPPEITQCDNACVFCFIHQQPKGMRKSLYVMDDDYRYLFF
jgi:NifB/MoaA-like Fe-S oxidoreductase